MNLQDLAARLQQQTRQSRFFGAARKGENYELRADLNSEYRDRRKDAIKRVIANMTVGKDVSGLFPDVLKNMQTDDLEQKKLVYLYLMNYAKTQPELVILAVNTFVKDTDDPNPLIRALAIRTMGCLRADKILDYLCDPLRKCLKDESPYVRKTAAICVAKLYDLKSQLAIENGFVGALVEMLSDANPMVVANAVTALLEIQETISGRGDGSSLFTVDSRLLGRLLIALGECTEWGRIAILAAVSSYRAVDEKEAEHICERVVPQFQHANASVVLAAVQVILVHLRTATRPDFIKGMLRKMAPPLVTLVSTAPEVQWVALRNINLILQKRPEILSSEIRVFFCKYNDPPYVKAEKLEIMIKLAIEKNVETLLSELKEYASEADIDFVRKAVRAIGLCAIKVDSATDRCVATLMELTSTRISYIVQEALVVLKDIFRRFPQRFEGVIPSLCSNLDELDEPEAKASLIWMIGEYAERITNADDLLERMLKNLIDEPYSVQLQTLTAVVKLFLKRPEAAQTLVQRTLTFATKMCDNADLRDRAYIYWRLLSADPSLSKTVVLADKQPIEVSPSSVSPALLEELISELSSLASVYHKPVETFVGPGRLGSDAVAKKITGHGDDASNEKAFQTLVAGHHSENLLDVETDSGDPSSAVAFGITAASRMDSGAPASAAPSNPLDDLLGLFDAPIDPAALPRKAGDRPTASASDLLDGLF